MNAEERNVGGRMTNCTAPISVSSWRTTSASAFENAATLPPSRHASAIIAATCDPFGKCAPPRTRRR